MTETAGKWKLADHQLYAITMMDYNQSLAIYYEAGTGKTAIALAWIASALADGRIKNAMVMCPASMCGAWADSIEKMVKFEGYDEEDVKRLKEAVTITSYQKTYRTWTEIGHDKDGNEIKIKKIAVRDDKDQEWDAIIIDECHGIGNHSSVACKTCLTLSKLTKYRYIMSGTPVAGGKGKEDFSKLYGQLKFLDDRVWRNWSDFVRRYVIEMDRFYKPISYKAEELRELMKDHGIVCRLTDVFDMPEVVETNIPCPLVEKTVYKDIKRCNVSKYDIDIKATGTQYSKMFQICSGFLKTDKGIRSFRSSKDEYLKDFMSGTSEKVVIFCQYTYSIDHVSAICTGLGKKTVVFDGRSTEETWRQFQYGDAEVLVCQYQAGGTGLDLFVSHTMILWEPTMSALLLTQTKARIYRKGQTQNCRYYYLFTPGTIEERALLTVQSGEEISNKMLEDWANEENDRK